MKLLIAPPFIKIGLIKKDIERWLREDRKIMILAFEQSTIHMIKDVLKGEKGKRAIIIDSVIGNEMKSLLMFSNLMGRYNSGIIDELYGAYLARASSSSKEETFKIQRKIIMLASLIKYIEKHTSSNIRVYTSIDKTENWFYNLFDKVVMK